jgi:ABC-2 type transport system permease protein
MTIKSPGRIIMALVWPVLFFGMFGSQLGQNMGVNMGYDFYSFMLVGMLVNGIFMMTINGITTLVEDRENDFTQEILVSPVSRYSIIAGKIIGSSLTAYVQFFVTIIVGFILGARITAPQFWLLLAVSPLMCLAAGSLGILLVGTVKDTNTASLLSIMSTMVQMMLSGAMIPINHSTGLMMIISHILPMTYCVDLARGIFYAGSLEYADIVMYPMMVNLVVILSFTVIFFVAGTIGFVRSEKNK